MNQYSRLVIRYAHGHGSVEVFSLESSVFSFDCIYKTGNRKPETGNCVLAAWEPVAVESFGSRVFSFDL